MPNKGVKIEDVVVGAGEVASPDSTVTIVLDCFLHHGAVICRGRRDELSLGDRTKVAGLRQGIVGMRVGGKRRLRVAPHLAYGAGGSGTPVPPGMARPIDSDWIPPNAVLIFEVELVSILPPS